MNVLTLITLGGVLAAGQAEKPATAPAPSEPAAKAKTSATKPPAKKASGSSLDEELFGDLAGDVFEGPDKPKLGKPHANQPKKQPADKQPAEKTTPPAKNAADKSSEKAMPPAEDFPEGEDLGQERNPLLDLGQRMRRAESLISRGTTGNPTQKLQDGIANDLEQLIKQASQS